MKLIYKTAYKLGHKDEAYEFECIVDYLELIYSQK